MHLSVKEVPFDRENLLRFCSWREGLKRLWSIKRCAGLILLTQKSCWDGVTTSIEHMTCTAGDPLREGTKEGGIKCRHGKYFSMIYYWEIPGQHATVVFKVIFSMLEFFETWKAGQGATCRSHSAPSLPSHTLFPTDSGYSIPNLLPSIIMPRFLSPVTSNSVDTTP